MHLRHDPVPACLFRCADTNRRRIPKSSRCGGPRFPFPRDEILKSSRIESTIKSIRQSLTRDFEKISLGSQERSTTAERTPHKSYGNVLSVELAEIEICCSSEVPDEKSP